MPYSVSVYTDGSSIVQGKGTEKGCRHSLGLHLPPSLKPDPFISIRKDIAFCAENVAPYCQKRKNATILRYAKFHAKSADIGGSFPIRNTNYYWA